MQSPPFPSTNHLAPRYAISSIPPLPRPSSVQIFSTPVLKLSHMQTKITITGFMVIHSWCWSALGSVHRVAVASAASQETPRISRNPKVHYRTHKRPPPVCILGQPNPVHIPTSHLLEIHPNIIHPSTSRSSQNSTRLLNQYRWL